MAIFAAFSEILLTSAVAGFVAVWFNKLSVDRVKLLQALAALQLFVTAINLITGRGIGDKVTPTSTINCSPSFYSYNDRLNSCNEP